MNDARLPASPYAPPTLRALGTVHELTQTKNLQLFGDALLVGRDRTGGSGGAVNGS